MTAQLIAAVLLTAALLLRRRYNHVERSKQIAVRPFKHECRNDCCNAECYLVPYARRYNHVERSKQIAVRPFKHDEFDRFLVPAYPYYTTALTTMLGFAVLTLVFLYS